MRDFNLMVSGFCVAAGIVNLLQGDAIMGGAVLFLAVANYKLAGNYE